MRRKRTMSLVNGAFIALIAITAVTSVVNFLWLSELMDHLVRTPGLARELVDGYRRLDFEQSTGMVDPATKASRHMALAEKSSDLARQVAGTSRHSLRAMVSVAISSFGTIAAGIALMALVGRRIGAPLSMLLEASRRIADGELDYAVPYQAHDEMGALVRSFNRMARCLKRSLDQIVEQKRMLEERVRRATADLRDQSRTDELTGLPNLRHLRERFAQAVEQASKAQRPLTVAVAAIDHLKALNDTFGSDAGDLILVAFGRSLRAAAREADFVGRYAGGQFAILMPSIDAVPQDFAPRVERDLASVSRLIQRRTGTEVTLRLRLGAAQFPTDGYSLPALVAAAGRAREPHSGLAPAGQAADLVAEIPGKEPW